MKIFGIDVLTLEMVYVALSAVVAILVWVEAMLLRKNAGKLPDSMVFYAVSMTSSVWVVISAIALYFLDFVGVAISVPVAYGLYTLLGWVYSARLLGKDGLPDSPDDIVMPDKYLAFSQSFALVFFGLCTMVLFMPEWVKAFVF
ncbi:MAG: hypothetical protein Q4G13_06285 [Moraxella sp.]|nr:hypothetical protein [Moraxella sp.]